MKLLRISAMLCLCLAALRPVSAMPVISDAAFCGAHGAILLHDVQHLGRSTRPLLRFSPMARSSWQAPAKNPTFYYVCIVRLNKNGSLDSSLGSSGSCSPSLVPATTTCGRWPFNRMEKLWSRVIATARPAAAKEFLPAIHQRRCPRYYVCWPQWHRCRALPRGNRQWAGLPVFDGAVGGRSHHGRRNLRRGRQQ